MNESAKPRFLLTLCLLAGLAACLPLLIGLTGTKEQVADVAKRYGGYFAKAERTGASGYLVDHTRVTLLFGPEGEPIVIVPQEQGADAIEEQLERWVK